MTTWTGPSTVPETFIDTSGFYALLVRRDDRHEQAVHCLHMAREARDKFVTSDYVLDETATLLRARGLGPLSGRLFETLLGSAACRIEWMTADWFGRTRLFFTRHNDQSWSFTDCTSFVMMRQLKLRDALTKDEHFRAAGFNALLT